MFPFITVLHMLDFLCTVRKYELGKVWNYVGWTVLFLVAYLIVFCPCCLSNMSSYNHFIVCLILQIEADMDKDGRGIMEERRKKRSGKERAHENE